MTPYDDQAGLDSAILACHVRLGPALANAYQRPAGCKLAIKLAAIGQRWLEMERAMGIEPIRLTLPSL